MPRQPRPFTNAVSQGGAVGDSSPPPTLLLTGGATLLAPTAFVVFWSSGAIFVELGLRHARPLTFLSLRLLFAMAILWLITGHLKPAFPATVAEWRRVFATGLLLQVGYQSFFFLALSNGVAPGLLSLILGVQPLFTAAVARDVSTSKEWFGLSLGLAGLSLVIGDSLLSASASAFGVCSALLSLISITLGTILQDRTRTSLPLNMALQYTASAAVLTILAAVVESYAVTWAPEFAIALAWMVIVVSVAATLLLYHMIRRDKVTHVASLFYLVPPVTVGLDYLVFGHSLPGPAVLGMVLIVTALVLITSAAERVRHADPLR